MKGNLEKAVRAGMDAAQWGFDWDRCEEAILKVEEECDEVREALNLGEDALFDEIGDLLFAVCNVARKAGVDPDAALAVATEKFQRRFQGVLEDLRTKGIDPMAADLETMEASWVAVKLDES